MDAAFGIAREAGIALSKHARWSPSVTRQRDRRHGAGDLSSPDTGDPAIVGGSS
jgi:hypothetical protein